MPDVTSKFLAPSSLETSRTVLGPTVTLRGELTADEDLAIEGQFDGTIHLRDHCVTVGTQGQVKAEIETSRVVVAGAVTGNITASERIEIRKTGRVMGDLVAPAVSIEDGAYFKGSIEILREAESPAVTSRALAATAEPDSDE